MSNYSTGVSNQSSMPTGMPLNNIALLMRETADAPRHQNLRWQTARCSEVGSEWRDGDPAPKTLITFLNKGHHIGFEKADNRNALKWFDEAYPKWGKCMDAHAAMTPFDWKNYYKWKVSKHHANDADAPKYLQYLQHDCLKAKGYGTIGIPYDEMMVCKYEKKCAVECASTGTKQMI